MRRARYHYGPRRGQFGELNLPDRVSEPLPGVLLLHGGYWRGIYSYRLMRPLARALVERGFAVWNVEYRRVGLGGGRGGWPQTFEDVASAADFLTGIAEVDASRLASCGHSAGGHLALWLAGRHRLPEGAPGARPDQLLSAAISLAGVSDLERLGDFGLGTESVDRLLGGTIGEFPERFAAASPAALLPLGLPQLLAHGLLDSTVPPAMSEAYARRAGALGDDATYLPLTGLNHRQLIESWHHVVEPVAEYLDKHFA